MSDTHMHIWGPFGCYCGAQRCEYASRAHRKPETDQDGVLHLRQECTQAAEDDGLCAYHGGQSTRKTA